MFQPISFNVIRQALEWHALPNPELKLLALTSLVPNSPRAVYQATWPKHLIPHRYFLPQYFDPMGLARRFGHDCQLCFCDDVQISDCQWDPSNGQMCALLIIDLDITTLVEDYPLT